jgi:hypothetical protein
LQSRRRVLIEFFASFGLSTVELLLPSFIAKSLLELEDCKALIGVKFFTVQAQRQRIRHHRQTDCSLDSPLFFGHLHLTKMQAGFQLTLKALAA